MDIRNFFGGSSAKKSTNSNNNDARKSSKDNSDKKKIIKTMEQIANDRSPDSDSDTDIDDNATSGNIGSGMKVSGGGGKQEATHKSNGAPSKQVDSDASTTDDDDVVQIKKKKKPPQASPIKKRKALDSSDDDDSDGKAPTSDKKKAKRKVIDSSSDEEEEEDETDLDDYLEQMKKRRAEAMGNGNDDTKSKKKAKPTKAAASKKKKKTPPRKKYVDSSDSDEDEVMKDVESNDDDSDDDFQPNKKQESDSEEEEEVVEVQPKKKKPKASPKTSPKRKAAAPKKKKTSPKKESEQPSGPPKYHPPSSKLTSHIPYLETQIIKSHLTKSDLPKLPNDNPNFSDIEFTPGCLSGLTFVFSGILSTNDVATTATNTAMAINSPTKSEYYINRSLDCSNINCELSRDTATDIIKILGGKVTTSVSGKTDYLICGNILEDGRQLEEGSKYRKCMELWSGWRDKWRKEYTGEESSSDDDDDDSDNEKKKKKAKGKKKKLTAAQLKAKDPDTLVEVIRGIYEFYGLVTYLSEWKKGTLPEGERMELEARQRAQQAGEKEAAAPVVGVKKEEVKMEAKAPANPYANKAPPANPYANKAPPANPYANKAPPTNPYAKKAPPANPYANKAPSTNPYASKSSTFSSGNPYASKPAATASKTENGGNINHPGSGKELRENSLWADKYAPSSSMEILGNADSVNKLKKWLREWESKFINPKVKVKGLTGSNGPWKAALLSGPPGIGKTTTATLVARESGRDVLELNASDARSKKALSNALGDVTGSQVLSFDNMGDKKNKKKAPIQKRCIIMDEVDGMGAGDRSGMSELIQMIKKSKVPIICICNDRSSQKMKSLVGYCLDLRYRRPTKKVIARRAMQIGNIEGMKVEENAAEAMAESCGNDIRQVLNSLQMWSCNKNKTSSNGGSSGTNITYRDLKERQSEINKDEVLRVSMFDACKSIVEGARGLSGSDAKAANASFYKRTDAYFVDYMLMGLMVHQNYLKVCGGQYNAVKVKGDDNGEMEALNEMSKATDAMSDFGMAEDNLRGGDQNWALLPLCSVLAVKVGHHAGGPTGGMLPGYAEFAGWLGKNSTRNKKIRLLQELRRHMNYKVSADAPELRMNYLPIMRKQFEELLFCKDGAMVTEAIELMDEYGLDRDDVFENFDEFLFNAKDLKVKKFADLDSKTKSAFTRAYNSMAHSSQALVAEQGAEKTGRKKASGGEMGGAELDVVDDDKVEESDEDDDEDDIEALQKKFLKKGRKSSGGAKANGKKKGGKKK